MTWSSMAATIFQPPNQRTIQTNPSESTINILKYCRIHFISFHFHFFCSNFFCASHNSWFCFFPNFFPFLPFFSESIFWLSLFADTHSLSHPRFVLEHYALYFLSYFILCILWDMPFIFHNNFPFLKRNSTYFLLLWTQKSGNKKIITSR